MDNRTNQKAVESNIILRKNKCGARVFGTPVCRNLASFIEDVSPSAYQQRLLSMFFAGSFPMSISINSVSGFDEVDFEDCRAEEQAVPKAEVKKAKGKGAKEK